MNEIAVVYEDNDLLVINKPPGIVVNRAETVKGETVQDWIEGRETRKPITVHSELDQEFVNRSGIVHRIDKETSGCLLIAKTPDVFAALKQQFMDRTVKKTYLAIAHGNLVPGEGEIRAPVGRLPWNRERFGIVPGGKDAVTRYRVLGTYVEKTSEWNWVDKERLNAKEDQTRKEKPSRSIHLHLPSLTIVELEPLTGRTHQIRVHLKYINHPIVGDYLYAGRKTSRSDRQWAPRVMLHAWKVFFLHPVLKSVMQTESIVPTDMKELMVQRKQF